MRHCTSVTMAVVVTNHGKLWNIQTHPLWLTPAIGADPVTQREHLQLLQKPGSTVNDAQLQTVK